MSTSAQAASHRVLTVTRSCRACGPTGGQNQKAPLPSCAGDPVLLSRPPSCSAPTSLAADGHGEELAFGDPSRRARRGPLPGDGSGHVGRGYPVRFAGVVGDRQLRDVLGDFPDESAGQVVVAVPRVAVITQPDPFRGQRGLRDGEVVAPERETRGTSGDRQRDLPGRSSTAVRAARKLCAPGLTLSSPCAARVRLPSMQEALEPGRWRPRG
jgi:hypothetical protein